MRCQGLLISRVLVLLLLLSACSPSEAQVATAIAQTETAKPTATFTPQPTATQTPEPTRTSTPTLEPTPTLVLPDVVRETYSDIDVIYRDDFGSNLLGLSPTGWHTDGERVYTTNEASLEINGRSVVAYLDSPTISANEAVIVRFKFSPGSHFTIGIDGLRQDQRIPAFQPGFRSISIEFKNSPLAYYVREQNHYYARFEGNLKLLPDIWYMYTQGFAPGKQFVIKIWDPENPNNVLTHTRQVDDMTNENIFIMWVEQGSRLFIDDLTFIKFSQLLE